MNKKKLFLILFLIPIVIFFISFYISYSNSTMVEDSNSDFPRCDLEKEYLDINPQTGKGKCLPGEAP